MAASSKVRWGETEFYEILCLMTVGNCCWLIGIQLGAFRILDRLIEHHGMSDLLMLGFFIGLGALVGSMVKSISLRRAIRERDAAEAAAAAVARHDPLTGLSNRRRLAEVIEAHRVRRRGCAILLIDLDRFKPINELHGRAVGDTVLTVVADRLTAAAPHGSLPSRLSGDEFALLVELDADTGAEHLQRLGRTIIAKLSAPVAHEGLELEVGATIGIAQISRDTDAEAVLHAADLALAQGKKTGRGECRIFDPAMSADLHARALRERELRHAINAGEIVPYYQPVITLATRALTGFEVLARWQHPTLGLLAPVEFITIAEETGMIADLSYALLRRACQDATTWPDQLQLAVNISPQQFEDPELADKIIAILDETGFSPARLEVEITESALVNDLEATRRTLEALQARGVRIALDDFGTGYSSLFHLRELRFDKLKIDRSYINAIASSSERAQLVDAIIQLGRSLDLVTTAEGIETDSSVDWLETQGCDYGQGYLFGKPMSKEQADRQFLAGLLPISNANTPDRLARAAAG